MKSHSRGAIGKVDPSMKGRSRRPMLAALTGALGIEPGTFAAARLDLGQCVLQV